MMRAVKQEREVGSGEGERARGRGKGEALPSGLTGGRAGEWLRRKGANTEVSLLNETAQQV